MAARTQPVSVRDLARFQKLPERFLAKLFTRLTKAGIVKGIEGIRGGFALARQPDQISVMDVLAAIDPNRSLFECAEIRRNCELFKSKPPSWCTNGMCRIHLVMQEAETAMKNVLTAKSLADLGREFKRKAPDQFLRNAEHWFQQCRSERINHRSGESRKDGFPQEPSCSANKQCNHQPKKNVKIT